MTFEIKLELQESDLERFRTLFREAQKKSPKAEKGELLRTADNRIQEQLESEQATFVRHRLEGMKKLVSMLQDEAWDLPEDDGDRIMEAIAYFVEGDDAISDSIPVLGLLDDAIVAELILRSLRHELDAYDDFCRFRTAEQQRRENRGASTEVSKEDWLADRRATLHSRMREHRLADTKGWHTITLWGFD